jgi:hypothetical protein
MGRQAQKRASRPRAPEGSHPPPRQQPYSADVTKRRYKAPGVGGASKNDPAGAGVPASPCVLRGRFAAPQDEAGEWRAIRAGCKSL